MMKRDKTWQIKRISDLDVVRAVAGGVTGRCDIVETGTPTTGQVKVENTSGQIKLTFAAGDAVTTCRARWIAVPRTRDGKSWLAKLAEIVA